jgi:hypothetical protein
MSIEMQNPKTLVEKIDAAANYVAQMLLAHKTGNEQRLLDGHNKAQELLGDAICMAEDSESLINKFQEANEFYLRVDSLLSLYVYSPHVFHEKEDEHLKEFEQLHIQARNYYKQTKL